MTGPRLIGTRLVLQLERNAIHNMLHQRQRRGRLATPWIAVHQQQIAVGQQARNQEVTTAPLPLVHGAVSLTVDLRDVVQQQLLQLRLIPIARLHRQGVQLVVHPSHIVLLVDRHPTTDDLLKRQRHLTGEL